MAPTDGRVAKPKRRWYCRRGTPWVERASECQDVKNYKWRINPVLHRMLLYPCGNSGRQRVNARSKADAWPLASIISPYLHL